MKATSKENEENINNPGIKKTIAAVIGLLTIGKEKSQRKKFRDEFKWNEYLYAQSQGGKKRLELEDCRFVALYDFNVEARKKLPLKKGDEVIILRQEKGWGQAIKVNDYTQHGWVPITYLAKKKKVPDNSNNIKKDNKTKRKRIIKCRAKYDYNGTKDYHLSFQKNDILVVTKKNEKNMWWVAYRLIEPSRKGNIPPKYVVELSDPDDEIVLEAKYDFKATKDHCFSLKKGDRLILVEKDNKHSKGWWNGYFVDKPYRVKKLPASYVTELGTRKLVYPQDHHGTGKKQKICE